MNDTSNVTPLASAKAANGKTPAAPQKATPDAPQASPAVSEAVSGKADVAAAPAAQITRSADVAAPKAKGTPGASSAAADARDAGLWEAVKVGDVVLVADHSDGEFQGWWPAKVLTRAGDGVTCEWIGYAEAGRQVRALSAIALLHPLHKD